MPYLVATKILRAAAPIRAGRSWSDTLHLPKSQFPSRPTASQLEQYRLRCADDLYNWQKVHRTTVREDGSGHTVRNEFRIQDGPPYANGAVHIGHALNKILKDVINRWQLAKGKRIQYQPGWDCHGLPIELKALQSLARPSKSKRQSDDSHETNNVTLSGPLSAPETRAVAKQLASQVVEIQKASFREWGIMGDWDKPYTTMDPGFEIEQLRVFREMVNKGIISRHLRPVYWSPSSRTALAEAELEYDDGHTSTAAFVKMPFTKPPAAIRNHTGVDSKRVSALIWTTTPWTLPANQAVAINEHLEYTLVSLHKPGDVETANDQVLIAKERLDYVLSLLPQGSSYTTIMDVIRGSELIDGPQTYNLFRGLESPILHGDFVNATSGTGLVHCAAGHGMEDYQLCLRHGLGPPHAPVDDNGQFTAEAFPSGSNSSLLEGLDAQSQGVVAVLNVLNEPSKFLSSHNYHHRGSLVLATHEFTHKYPIDWRTKQPVIVRATAQWFADVSAIKGRTLAALEKVSFIPDGGKTRLTSFINGRSQWCISRQRSWGVPIPALYNRITGESCVSTESINHIIDVISERGSDAWFSDPPDDKAWIHPSLDQDVWARGKDTMDVWFDSGTTWTTSPNKQQSDVYVEGTDQHRGWFQSSLLTYIASQDSSAEPVAPYRTLITHGFTLDGEGRKMSKSLGNVISPTQVQDGSLLPPLKLRKQRGRQIHANEDKSAPTFDAMGPDVLRLWVATCDYTRDVTISVPGLQVVQQALQKYRVTLKFLLGNLQNFSSSFHEHGRPLTDGSFADRAVLHMLSKTGVAVFEAFEEYKFYKVINEVNAFINNDLSAFYFEIVKDRLYAGSDKVRRDTQRTLTIILREVLRILMPITPHLVEEAWTHISPAMKASGDDATAGQLIYPFHEVWAQPFQLGLESRDVEEIDASLRILKTLSMAVKAAQEDARNAGKLGSGLACKVIIQIPANADGMFQKCLTDWARAGELSDMLVTSQALVQHERPPQAEWVFNKEFEAGQVQGMVHVLPPEHHKCVRCWKYTAKDAETPCERCVDVINAHV